MFSKPYSLKTNNIIFTDPGGRAVNGVGFQSFDKWYRGFESRRGYGCSPTCVCCVGSGLCDGLITRSEGVLPCVCVSVYELRPPLLSRLRMSYYNTENMNDI